MTTKVKKTKAKSKTTVETKDEDYVFPPTKDKTPTLTKVEPKEQPKSTLWKPLGSDTEVLPVPGGVVIARGGTMVFTPKVRLKKNVQGDWTLVS